MVKETKEYYCDACKVEVELYQVSENMLRKYNGLLHKVKHLCPDCYTKGDEFWLGLIEQSKPKL